jgi:hypothetical protein
VDIFICQVEFSRLILMQALAKRIIRMRIALPAFALAALALATPANAMDGVNLDTGDAVTVDDNTVFNVGDVIALYDADGNEIDVLINNIKDTPDATDIDVTDQDSGETATFEFSKQM